MQNAYNWTFNAPLQHACYPHHFAQDALVPGALLLHWIQRELRVSHQAKITQIKQIKFLQAVRPAAVLVVTLTQKADSSWLLNVTNEAGEVALKGQITLTAIDSNPSLIVTPV